MDTSVKSHINMKNARFKDQAKVMQSYIDNGQCPFCPGTQARTLKPIIRSGRYWDIRKNRWPYKNTKKHFLIIAKSHWRKLSDIPKAAAAELMYFCEWLERRFKIVSGGIAGRFGDFRFNGSTVDHLHFHVIEPDPKKTKKKKDKVRFKIS